MSRLVPALLVYYIRATAQAWVAHQRVTRPPQRKQQLDQFSFSHLNPHINPLYAGAIYLWARLPKHAQDDTRAVEWLVKKHGVCVIPGSSCGAPVLTPSHHRAGVRFLQTFNELFCYIRAAYANLKPGDCQRAAGRLKTGLSELVHDGNALAH
eukprot:scaffold41848_cov19-Tisochrysis_lutea.AAC.1